MCFQRFAHYSCGHIGIQEETTCDLGADVPFYIKVACPNYAVNSITPGLKCGKGGFYCQQNQEGRFLEQIFEVRDNNSAELQFFQAREQQFTELAAVFNDAAGRAGISEPARKENAAYQSIMRNLAIVQQKGAALTMERTMIVTIIECGYKYCRTLAQANLKGHAARPFPSFLPPQVRSALPSKMQAQLAAMVPDGLVAPSPVLARIEGVNGDMYDTGARTEAPGHQNTWSTTNMLGNPANPARTVQEGLSSESGHPSTSRTRRRLKQVTKPTRSATSLGASNGNRDGLTKTSIPLSESPKVRRSARIKGNRVSYAESEGSTTPSREVSPEKSHADKFMPTNSDADNSSPARSVVSASPPRRPIHRRRKSPDLRKDASGRGDSNSAANGSSLSSLMSDWKRRNIAAPGVPGQQQSYFASAMNNHPPTQTNANNSTFTSLPIGAESMSLPQILRRAEMAAYGARANEMPSEGGTIAGRYDSVMPPGRANFASSFRDPRSLSNSTKFEAADRSHEASHAFTIPTSGPRAPNTTYQLGHSQQHYTNPDPDSLSNVLVSSDFPGFGASPPPGDFQHATSVPMGRNDSAIALPTERDSILPASASFSGQDYDGLRRGFSAAADLTPPAKYNVHHANTDPKKRSLPASSPLLPPNKRMRLSMPGEGVAGTREDGRALDVVGSISSPAKMKSPQLVHGQGAERGENLPDLPVTPAPILAPTAMMYVPSHDRRVSGSAVDEGGASVIDGSSTLAPLEDGNENEFSDIDWSLINDDFSSF